MSYIKLMLAVFLLSFLMVGGELYKIDQENGIERDIYDYTDQINLTRPTTIEFPIEKTRGIINQGRLMKIINSGIDFLMTSAEQVSKMGIEYGYQNPDFDFKSAWKYIVYILIIAVVLMLLKPIGYLITFIIMVVIMLKEKNRQRKKRLERSKQ